ncbi:MAG: transglutaminase-like domain-containing protein [Salinivirgaceae bacterium]|nr:transglutaminase-like domain-containing protein [Salinivirgaceae bacterium]
MDKREIQSIIKLLDDPDQSVFMAIRNKLTQMGTGVIPFLETAWENSLDELFQSRIESIIQEIHHSNIKSNLKKWESSGNDLLQGALLIAQFQYPEINQEEILKTIELLKKDVWLEINENLTALEKIKIVNHIFFDVHNYSRSNTFQNSPQSNYINQLIESKKGSPIALSILYAGICQQLNIPIFGVALPKNFILCYKDPLLQAFDEDMNEGVLFYINPFNKGVVFGKKEIEAFIKQQKLENKKAYFQPCSNKETIIHLLNQLIEFYDSMGDKTKSDDFRSLLKILYF